MRLAALAVERGVPGREPASLQPVGEVWLTEGFIDRLLGVFATPGDRPVLLQDCRRVHGFGLRRPLFLTFLDSHGAVLGDGIVVRPWTTACDTRASHVLESFEPLAMPIGSRLFLSTLQAGPR